MRPHGSGNHHHFEQWNATASEQEQSASSSDEPTQEDYDQGRRGTHGAGPKAMTKRKTLKVVRRRSSLGPMHQSDYETETRMTHGQWIDHYGGDSRDTAALDAEELSLQAQLERVNRTRNMIEHEGRDTQRAQHRHTAGWQDQHEGRGPSHNRHSRQRQSTDHDHYRYQDLTNEDPPRGSTAYDNTSNRRAQDYHMQGSESDTDRTSRNMSAYRQPTDPINQG